MAGMRGRYSINAVGTGCERPAININDEDSSADKQRQGNSHVHRPTYLVAGEDAEH